MNHFSAPPAVGPIDWTLNKLEQDDPKLVEAVRDIYLVSPSKAPYSWKVEDAGLSDRLLAGQYGQPMLIRNMLRDRLEGGFFIEAGAYDGLALSNSLLFELRY